MCITRHIHGSRACNHYTIALYNVIFESRNDADVRGYHGAQKKQRRRRDPELCACEARALCSVKARIRIADRYVSHEGFSSGTKYRVSRIKRRTSTHIFSHILSQRASRYSMGLYALRCDRRENASF